MAAAMCMNAPALLAQQLDVQWVTAVSGSGGHIYSTESTVDSNGNVFTVGSFRDSIEVSTLTGMVKLVSKGEENMFVARMNAGGGIEWIKQVGGKKSLGNSTGNSSDQFINHFFSVVSDHSGNVYITGNFRDTVDFDPGAGTVKRYARSVISGSSFPGTPPPMLWYENGFILKLNSDGEFVWVRTLAGNPNSIADIAIDKDGRTIAVTGYFADTVDFNNSLGTDVFYSGRAGKRDVFVARYDTAGQFIWARQMGTNASGNPEGRGISINDQGYIFTTGIFYDSSDFDPGPTADILRSTAKPGTNVFVSKLDSNGNHVWARAMGSLSPTGFGARAAAIVADHSGNVLTTGYFQTIGSFDPLNIYQSTVASSIGGLSMFISKLDSAGHYVWAKALQRPAGAAGVEQGLSVAVDDRDAVYIAGYFTGNLFLDPDPAHYPDRDTFNGGGNSNPFLIKLDAGGNYEWGKSVSSVYSRGYQVVVSPEREVYLTGNFEGVTEFNPRGASHQLTSVNSASFDGFTMKLYCADTSIIPMTMEVCADEFTLNGTKYTSNGIYTQKFVNASGCDSTIILDLTLYPFEPARIKVDGNILGTIASYKTYQWIRNDTALQGATDSVYHVTSNGDYRVAITTANDCPDTSDVYEVRNVGVEDLMTYAASMKIYPNPARKMIYISSPLRFDVRILSVEGKLVRSEHAVNAVAVGDLTPGLYFLKVHDADGNLLRTEKFIKE